MSRRPRLLTSTPLFVVSDLPRSLAFYERLGFRANRTWGDPPCFAMPRRDGLELMLSLAEDRSRVRPNGPDGVWDMYLRVADLGAEKAALEAAGVAIARAPEQTVYEMLEMEVLDPDGYRICFAQDTSEDR
jgi:catechol 2,3-dioxygenase-like lactoylglutathione lyase family enzyme